MTNKIVVIGSTNVDKILNVERFALPGETTLTNNSQVIAGGGKGANQALATSRSGADTLFISKVGKEGDAEFMMKNFKEAKINTDFIFESEKEETGQAYITVDSNGQNSIYVYGGANMDLTPDDVEKASEKISESDSIIAQMEIPVPAIIKAFEIARKNNVKTILNPAPAKELPKELLELTDIIIPNETEAEYLTGIKIEDENSMIENANFFFNLGIEVVLITVGSKGSFYATKERNGFVPAFKVKAVDTTAAGDTFIGALSTQLKSDLSNIEESMKYANRASSLTVQTKGAQNSIPTEEQIRNA